MAVIYHVTDQLSWQQALETGFYEAPSLKAEGFIHCSEHHQVQGVLERYYMGAKGLVMLVIDTEKLQSQLIYDWSPSTHETFPHVYGPVNTDAVSGIESIPDER